MDEGHSLALPKGYRIENFKIESILGKGGFGITYAATNLLLNKTVAIKELLPDSIATRGPDSKVISQSRSLEETWRWAKERFLEEARFLAGFSHPAIIGVHHLIEANGTVYLVMDYIDGVNYEQHLLKTGLVKTQTDLASFLRPLLDGLKQIHLAGLIHRDIKPENILIKKDGSPVLIDFGSARASAGTTAVMTSIVTHGYSPIEQYQTKGKMGPWTDIYALGAVAYRAITGTKPPVAADRITETDFLWLQPQKIQGFSEQCLAAIDWALRLKSQDRPQKIEDWEPFLHLPAIPKTTPPPLPPPQKKPSTRPPPSSAFLFLLPAALSLLAACLLLALFFKIQKEKPSPAQAPTPTAESAKQETPPEALPPLPAERFHNLSASKKFPFTNSLGMRFIPVAETGVLFGIWNTRVRDYATYASSTEKKTDSQWLSPGFGQTPEDPVVKVSWNDAKAFCAWLTAKEQQEGFIAKNQFYRLPTDAEWSAAVGGRKFPWGKVWPPPTEAGNYAPDLGVDDFEATSPAGSFPPNSHGLYDMGGNVWQWCEDWYRAEMNPEELFEKYPDFREDGGGKKFRVVRGASFSNDEPERLWGSSRGIALPNFRSDICGFRCVLDESP